MITGGFSSVNTRLAFDTEILLPNVEEKAENDNALKKDYNHKVVYNLKLNDKKFEKKRIISKISKLGKNDQYGHGMTKPLATGCIKNNNDISWKTFNYLIEKTDLEDKIGHLFVVDFEFDDAMANPQQNVYNEIYPPIIEKQKIIDPCERLVYQLIEQYAEGEKNNSLAYRATKKAHAAMLKNRFLLMYYNIMHL